MSLGQYLLSSKIITITYFHSILKFLIMLLTLTILDGFNAIMLLLVVVCSGILYYAKPKPLKGIPYNTKALGLLGDLPSLGKYVSRHNVFLRWMALQARNLDSPIIQLFIRPFSAPIVVLCDYREVQDILLRRGKEFDRANLQGDLFRPLVPNHHIHMKTNAAYKTHRKLIRDLMTPAFLNEVAAPAIHLSAEKLVDLWARKSILAENRPFEVSTDFFRGALDAVFAFTFGSNFRLSATERQLKYLTRTNRLDLPTNVDDIAIIPVRDEEEETEAILTFASAVDKLLTNPFPAIKYALIKLSPSWKKKMEIKNRIIHDAISDSLRRLKSEENFHVQSAIDHIIHRETTIAAKSTRAPEYFSGSIQDEVRSCCPSF